MNGGAAGRGLRCSAALATFCSCSRGCETLCSSQQRKRCYTPTGAAFTHHREKVNPAALGSAPVAAAGAEDCGHHTQPEVSGGHFSERSHLRRSGRVGLGQHGGAGRPGLATETASHPPAQEQRWLARWRWDLSHALALCSNARCVEGL